MPAWWQKLLGRGNRQAPSRNSGEMPVAWRFDHSLAERECRDKFRKFANNLEYEIKKARGEQKLGVRPGSAALVVLGKFDPEERKNFPGLGKKDVERIVRSCPEFGNFENYCRYMGFTWEIEESEWDEHYPRHYSHTQTTGAGGIAGTPHWTPKIVKLIRLRAG